VKYSQLHRLAVEPGQKIYFDDTDGKIIRYRRRVDTLFNEGATSVIIVGTDDIPKLEGILGVPVTELLSFNAVKETVTGHARLSQGADKGKRAKHQRRLFTLNRSKHKLYKKGVASDVWDVLDVDVNNTKGLFVPIDRFHPVALGLEGLVSFKETLQTLENIGIHVKMPIFGVKGNEPTGNLTRFDEWVKAQLNKRVCMMRQHALALCYENEHPFDVGAMDAKKVSDPDAKAYVSLYHEARGYYASAYHHNRVVAYRLAGISVERDKRLKPMAKQFSERYPLLELVGNRGRAEVYEYIRERDALRATKAV
jgi:hypothetical protein